MFCVVVPNKVYRLFGVTLLVVGVGLTRSPGNTMDKKASSSSLGMQAQAKKEIECPIS